MATAVGPPGILSFEEARHTVEGRAATVCAPPIEAVDLANASGRALAEPLIADRDLPPFPRATRDGFAVVAADLQTLPAVLQLAGEIRAGETAAKLELQRGHAIAIMTGAPVPSGADAVVMIEFTSQSGSAVTITRSAAAGDNIVPRGAEGRQGSTLLDRGSNLDEAGIALAASVGKDRIEVYTRPRVAVLTTGDEIVAVGDSPGPAQIRNSNAHSLAVQIRNAGGEPVLLPIAPDDLQALRRLIEQGLGADLLLITGGVSVGRYDLVERVLAEMGAEFFFTGALIQPGRPVVFGRVLGKYFFGLPGNPVSTMVTFELFVRPMLQALGGRPFSKLKFLHARLKTEIKVKPGLKRFLPALISGEFEESVVELVAWQGSGDLAAVARANCYLVVPPDRTQIAAGEWVAVMMRHSAI
jgi:molybdopterin molybdotransferase